MKKSMPFWGPLFRSLSLTVVIGAGSYAFAGHCDDLLLKNKIAAKGAAVEAFDWKPLAEKDVVLFGEEHTLTREEDLFDLLKRAKNASTKSGPVCLFLEWPVSLSVEDLRKITHSTPKSPNQKRYFDYYNSLMDGAESLGYQLKLVDHPDNITRNWELTLNDRDAAMGKNIVSLMKAGTCARGVMAVGKNHISPNKPDRVMLREHLKAGGLSSVTVNVQYAHETIPIQAMYSWNGLCTLNAVTAKPSSVFNNAPFGELNLAPYYSKFHLIKYFDWTVLYP